LVENRDSFTIFAFDVPVRGWSPSDYYYRVWYEKLEWCGYPTVKEFEDNV